MSSWALLILASASWRDIPTTFGTTTIFGGSGTAIPKTTVVPLEAFVLPAGLWLTTVSGGFVDGSLTILGTSPAIFILAIASRADNPVTSGTPTMFGCAIACAAG